MSNTLPTDPRHELANARLVHRQLEQRLREVQLALQEAHELIQRMKAQIVVDRTIIQGFGEAGAITPPAS